MGSRSLACTTLATGGVVALALLVGATATAAPTKCPVQGCGSNTPELSASYFIEKLNLQGLPDENGTRYKRGSFRCLGNSRAVDLAVRAGALVGVDAQGRVACTDLRGARFWIVPTRSSRSPDIEITITHVGEVETWQQERSERETLPTYRFTWLRDGRRASFCPQREASWMEPWQLVGHQDPQGPGGLWHETTDHLLIIQGETYTPAARVDPERSGPAWISLGCAGAAFSKLRLLGYDPMRNTSTVGEREATLKMITARYKGEESHTVQGVPLAWISMRGVQYEGAPDRDRLGPIEALWGPDGASCLSHLRLFHKDRVAEDSAPEVLQRNQIGLPACEAYDSISGVVLSARLTSSPPPGAVWATISVDHISHRPLPISVRKSVDVPYDGRRFPTRLAHPPVLH